MLSAVGATWAPATAHAGEYTVWSCRGPEGTPISTAAWHTRTNDAEPGDIEIADTCATGGSLAITVGNEGISPDRKPRGEAVFGLPRGATIAGFKMWRYVVAAADYAGAEYNYAAATRELSVGGSSFDFGCASGLLLPSYNCSWEGTPSSPLDAANLFIQISSPLEGLSFWASCIRVGCKPPITTPAAEFKLFRSAVSIEDDDAPEVEKLQGSLAESPPITEGAGNLFVTAADTGGGVAAFEFEVDGGAPRRVAVGGGCEEPFSEPRPCPREATRGIAVDTASLAPGAHSVAGRVTDAAGNATRFGPVDFTVASPAAPEPSQAGSAEPLRPGGGSTGVGADGGRRPDNGTPAVESPTLRLDAAKGLHRPARSTRLKGTLATATGEPIAGARLDVEVVEIGGKRDGEKHFVYTDAAGHYAFDVPGKGAQNVVVSYAPVLGGGPSRTVKALVRSKLGLSLTPHPSRLRTGQTVRFRGRLDGAGKAARGAVVAIQAIAGGRWTTVDTVAAGPDGRFTWTHRFRYVESDALFSFRAVVPRTPGWPWPTIRSRRIELPIKGPAR